MLNATGFSIFSRYYLRSSEQCDSKLANGKNKAKRRKRKGINFLLHTYYLIRARYSVGLFLYVLATSSYIVVNPQFTHLIFILLLLDLFCLVMAVKPVPPVRAF